MPNIKEIALKVAKKMREESEYDVLDLVCNAEDFAEALVAELAKGNEPVAWWNGKETAFFEHEVDGPVGEVRIPLYTLPPTASKIEQETAEACAKVYLNTYDLTDIAEDIRNGAWKEFKK